MSSLPDKRFSSRSGDVYKSRRCVRRWRAVRWVATELGMRRGAAGSDGERWGGPGSTDVVDRALNAHFEAMIANWGELRSRWGCADAVGDGR